MIKYNKVFKLDLNGYLKIKKMIAEIDQIVFGNAWIISINTLANKYNRVVMNIDKVKKNPSFRILFCKISKK